jgi:SAM-dependent methyltransferase
MPVRIGTRLTAEQVQAMKAFPATSWFTQFVYDNASSPVHPNGSLLKNNAVKLSMVEDWIAKTVRGKRVLDLFSANGGFSVVAALAGASEVIGVEFSPERVDCARFIGETITPICECRVEFVHGDVYDITEMFDTPFDIVFCFGGLYHVADPALILRKIGDLTRERLLLQTSQVWWNRGNRARFVVRREERTAGGLTSIRQGYGTWHCSPGCLRELLLHGGFIPREERRPPWYKRHRYPWYFADCERV